MYAILGETKSDAECMKILLKRILSTPNLSVKIKGFQGCGDLLKKGSRQIHLFQGLGCTRFVIAVDADASTGRDRKIQAQKVVSDANCASNSIIVVPVEEIESWILSDPHAVAQVIRQLSIPSVVHPENIENPKEWLVSQSRSKKSRPLYVPATNNAPICNHIDLQILKNKCSTFADFQNSVLEKWA